MFPRPLRRLAFASALLVCALTSSLVRADDARPLPVDATKLHPLTFQTFLVRLDDSTQLGATQERLALDVLDHLRKRGYPAVGGENVLFGENHADAARFVLGGTIREGDCKTLQQREHCMLGIEWQLFDREREAVIYQVTTRFRRMQPLTEEDSASMWTKLVEGSLDRLLSRAQFVSALTRKPGDERSSEEASYAPASFRACTDAGLSMPKDTERVMAATVLISTNDAIGSGVIVSPDGYVLTAAHVMPTESAKARLRDGREFELKLVRFSTKYDVALAKLELPDAPCLPLAASLPQVGSEMWAVGTPLAKEFSFSVARGVISGIRFVKGGQYVQTDASLNPGNSGGPMVNEHGQVLAVVSWKVVLEQFEGLAFGVPGPAALERLTLAIGTTSETDKLAPLGHERFVKERPKTFVDTADDKIVLDAKGDLDRARKRATPAWVRTLRLVSTATALTGLTLASTSWLVYDESTSTQADYERLRRRNDIGWAMAGAGALAFGLSYLYRPSEAELKRATVKEASATLTSRGTVELRVRY